MSYRLTSEQKDQVASEIVFALDPDGNFTFLNRAGEQLSGYSCAEVRRMNITEMVAPEFAGYVRNQLRDSFGECYGLVYEIEILTKDGRRVALEASTQMVFGSSGRSRIQGIAVPAKERTAGSENKFGIRCVDRDFVFQS